MGHKHDGQPPPAIIINAFWHCKLQCKMPHQTTILLGHINYDVQNDGPLLLWTICNHTHISTMLHLSRQHKQKFIRQRLPPSEMISLNTWPLYNIISRQCIWWSWNYSQRSVNLHFQSIIHSHCPPLFQVILRDNYTNDHRVLWSSDL
jgi:hypothetical protein